MQQKMQYNNFLYYYYYFTQGVADMKMLCWQSWPFPPRGPCFVPFLGQSLAHILFRKKHSSPPPPQGIQGTKCAPEHLPKLMTGSLPRCLGRGMIGGDRTCLGSVAVLGGPQLGNRTLPLNCSAAVEL